METKIGENTFILFPRRTFAQGIELLFDVRGASLGYHYSNSPEEADTKAIAADWRAVANDLRIAYENYRALLEQKQTVDLGA
jgi:hypothetical protein